MKMKAVYKLYNSGHAVRHLANNFFLKKIALIFLISFIFQSQSFGQVKDSFNLAASDVSVPHRDTGTARRTDAGQHYNAHRVKLVTIANVAGYGGTMAGLYSAWYSKYPQSGFHFFDDNSEWNQVDKAGHAYSAYIESYGSTEMWRWAGLSRRKAAVIGSVSALAYQTIIETLDGFSSEWGWSWGDMSANVFGSGLFLGQELGWNEQRIKFKFSFHRKDYGAAELNNRADFLYGSTIQERLIKDYNSQTYWLSANLKSFMPQSNLPPWLSVAFGYGAEGMFGAVENYGTDKQGHVFNRKDIPRYRQYYISPDIDLTKIKTDSKFLKLTLGFLNAFKFPAPSLEYNSRGKFGFHWLHF